LLLALILGGSSFTRGCSGELLAAAVLGLLNFVYDHVGEDAQQR